MRIWNPSDFQGQRSSSPGQIFKRGDTPRFALPLFFPRPPISSLDPKGHVMDALSSLFISSSVNFYIFCNHLANWTIYLLTNSQNKGQYPVMYGNTLNVFRIKQDRAELCVYKKRYVSVDGYIKNCKPKKVH